jgi:hypothetical protein
MLGFVVICVVTSFGFSLILDPGRPGPLGIPAPIRLALSAGPSLFVTVFSVVSGIYLVSRLKCAPAGLPQTSARPARIHWEHCFAPPTAAEFARSVVRHGAGSSASRIDESHPPYPE